MSSTPEGEMEKWRAALAPGETGSFHRSLVWVYLRQGKFQSALRHVEALLGDEPGDRTLIAGRKLLATLGARPRQRMLRCRETTVALDRVDGHVFIPASIDGLNVQCMIDSGASLSMLTESQAKMSGLHLTIAAPEDLPFFGVTGETVGFSLAVADRVTVGRCQLVNVPFIVLPDHCFPFPVGSGAALGLSVLLEFQTLCWTSSGDCHLGTPSRPREQRKSNLAFDNADLITEVTVEGEKMCMVLDTGSSATLLWRPSLSTHKGSAVSARQASVSLTGVSGTATLETGVLPELKMRIGDRDTQLRPAHILLRPTTPNSQWLSGQLGMDVLSQAGRVSMDFALMRLDLD